MSVRINSSNGNINIDEQVVATLAGLAAVECYGIVGMAAKSASEGLFELARKEHLTKGVKVTIKENKVVVDLFVVVQFGVRISTVAENIIAKVKYNLENFTGLEVVNVNVHVQGVRVL
ncbi:MAG: Asp23/Gls24 family envelope stress response protein [Tissierellales bacterium]|jgi:uncharacterized alkaline shock family protein YloU|nr:Asp23/Gls24 family envelope stress response protein [Tissierellales bacterium]MBN2827702.1 Asp23/Gls24 family envelope stress response protein [Tissierellales bacterium]